MPTDLQDTRGAKTTVTAAEVRDLVKRAADMLRIVDLGPTAIVTDDDVVCGMARMYSVLAEGVGAAARLDQATSRKTTGADCSASTTTESFLTRTRKPDASDHSIVIGSLICSLMVRFRNLAPKARL